MKFPLVSRRKYNNSIKSFSSKLHSCSETICEYKKTIQSLKEEARTLRSQLKLTKEWFYRLHGPADCGNELWRDRWESGRYIKLLHVSVGDAAGSGFRWQRTLNTSDTWCARGIVFSRNLFQYPFDMLLPPCSVSETAQDILLRLWESADVIIVKDAGEFFENRASAYLPEIALLRSVNNKIVPHFYGTWHRTRMNDQEFRAATLKFPLVAYLTPDLRPSWHPNTIWIPHAYPFESISPLLWNSSNRHRISHAPSSRESKGTPMFLDALERSKAKASWKVDLIESVPSEQARSRIASSGIFFDQCATHFSEGGKGVGWYGNAALEAAACGIPTITFLKQEYLEHARLNQPDWNDPPFFNVHPDPDNFSGTLDTIASIRDHEMEHIANRHWNWVQQRHGAQAILDATNALLERVARLA